jgi:DNA-binding MarR family transcriptional regulator/N-acetylglutamate synthase-like GNAT family acetyltransferase
VGDDVVADVRRFNRYWTQVLGLLDEGLLDTEHPLPEARVLFELAQRPVVERVELRALLGIDDSFFSRLLQRLQRKGLVATETSPVDGRRRVIRLTPAGRDEAGLLDERSAAQITALTAPLDPGERRRLAAAMDEIEQLTARAGHPATVVLRAPAPGDLGWVVARHGALYAAEYGWNTDFEALVARIVADFHDELAPGRERAWIAEVGGRRAGCVFAKRRDDATAQLRLLLVEPWARGLGVGRRLVDTCLDFARAAGYRSILLWTNDVLVAARRIYQAVGFELVEEEPHHSYGHDLVGQIWRRDL